MKIYFAGINSDSIRNWGIINRYLLSYFYVNTNIFSNKKIELFLDSGAFSAWKQGKEININEYINFIKENINNIDVYTNLDVIGDQKRTYENQLEMEKSGLNPLPVFHVGDDQKYLDYYINNYDYISFGGMVPYSNQQLIYWLDRYFPMTCNKDGYPNLKVHGFGLTSLKLMLRYPWYSVDSSTWLYRGKTGAILVPRYKNGKYIYDENPWRISVSDKSSDKKEAGKHINTLTPNTKKIILDYIKLKGYTLEGIANHYQLRYEMNIIYFNDLEKNMLEWPWPFKAKSMKGFGL